MDEETAAVRLARRRNAPGLIKRKKTDLARWTTLDELSDNPSWDDRAEAIRRFIPENARVLDLGCGDMKIERLLPAGAHYMPLDCVRRDARTIVVDLNKERLPEIAADFVLGLGVLEYLCDLPRVLRQLARQIPDGLFSYYPLEQGPTRDRLGAGWANALNSSELSAILAWAGYKVVEPHPYKPGLRFFRVSTRRRSS